MTINKQWFIAAGIRALKTFAQTAIATIGTATVLGGVDWLMVGSASVLAALLSVLTSIVGLPEVPTSGDTPDAGDDVDAE